MHTLEQLIAGELKGITAIKIASGLTTFPEDLFSLVDTLEQLDLSNNQLSELPSDFYRFRKLKILFLSENKFTIFPEVLGQCEQLEMIGFKANQISYISETALPPLTRWLILTNNHLSFLPDSIGKCYRMEKLMLAGNQLKALPTSLHNCSNLALLRIAANQLTEFPDWLLEMPNLSWLAYSGNPFAYQPASIEQELPLLPWHQLALQEQLGQGASGIISKALLLNDESSEQKTVAVKIFKGEITSDGLPDDEINACVLAGKHPHLVEVIGKIAAHPAAKKGLVFSLIPSNYVNLGITPSFTSCSRDVFAPDFQIPIEHTLKIAHSIASLAAHLHSKGINHGDLYAHNILINEQADTLMGDFGAASLYDLQDEAKAASLQRIEVRAFGCLLEDLIGLTIIDSLFQRHQLQALTFLKNACMQAVVQLRPSFQEILVELGKI